MTSSKNPKHHMTLMGWKKLNREEAFGWPAEDIIEDWHFERATLVAKIDALLELTCAYGLNNHGRAHNALTRISEYDKILKEYYRNE